MRFFPNLAVLVTFGGASVFNLDGSLTMDYTASTATESFVEDVELSFDDVFDHDYACGETDSDRYVIPSWFTADELSAAGEYMSTLAMTQRTREQEIADCVPALGLNCETIMLDSVPQRLVIGELIKATSMSTIFRVLGFPTIVIKYQADCDRDTPFHPLLRDHWFMKNLRDTGIVPMSYFVSPPTRLSAQVCRKTQFQLSSPERRGCAAMARTVRFMVMERVGFNLFEHVASTGGSLKLAVRVMKWLIQSLKVIHNRGITHGDIHGGNVVFMTPGEVGEDAAFGLIDFGLGQFHEELAISNPRPYGELSAVHCYHSQWELDGFRLSFRDDIYKTLLLGAYILHGTPWFDYCASLQASPADMREFKKSDFIFEYPDGPKLVESVEGPLSSLLRYTRTLTDPYVAVDYDAMVEVLDQIPIEE